MLPLALPSVATAYVLATNGGHPMPFAIYNDETVVGFVLIAYGITSYELPKIAEGNYTIIRFMIGEQFQNHGYGKEAMGKILEYIRTYPAGLLNIVGWVRTKAIMLLKNYMKVLASVITVK